jgi:hypothetical protein
LPVKPWREIDWETGRFADANAQTRDASYYPPRTLREEDRQVIRERWCAGKWLPPWALGAIRRDIPFLKDGLGSETWKAWLGCQNEIQLGQKSQWHKDHPEHMERQRARMDALQQAYEPLCSMFEGYSRNPDLADKNAMAAQYMPILRYAKGTKDRLSALNALAKIYGHNEVHLKVSESDDPSKIRADALEMMERLGLEGPREAEVRVLEDRTNGGIQPEPDGLVVGHDDAEGSRGDLGSSVEALPEGGGVG